MSNMLAKRYWTSSTIMLAHMLCQHILNIGPIFCIFLTKHSTISKKCRTCYDKGSYFTDNKLYSDKDFRTMSERFVMQGDILPFLFVFTT